MAVGQRVAAPRRARGSASVAMLLVLALLVGCSDSDNDDASVSPERSTSASVTTSGPSPTTNPPEPENQRRFELLDAAQLGGRPEANTRTEGCGYSGPYTLTAIDPASGTITWNVEVPAHTQMERSSATDLLVVPFSDGEPDPDDDYSSDTGLLTLDGTDGAPLWQLYLPGLHSTLTLDDIVVVQWDDGRLVSAFDLTDGRERWRAGLDSAPPEQPQDDQVVGDDDAVYWLDGEELVTVEPSSGTETSRKALPFSDDLPPDLRVIDGHLLYRRMPTTIGELDAATGDTRWEVDLGGTSVGWEHDGDLVSTGGLLTVTAWSEEQSSIVALVLGDGTEKWRFEHGDQGTVGALTVEPEGAISLVRITRDEAAYTATSELVAIDAQTGEERWSTDPIEQPYSGGPPPRSTEENAVFVLGSSADRRLYAYAPDSGAIEWSLATSGDTSTVGRTYDLLGSVQGSPWLVGNDEFWEPSYVTSIDPASRIPHWQVELTGNDLTLGPSIDGRQIVAAHNLVICE